MPYFVRQTKQLQVRVPSPGIQTGHTGDDDDDDENVTEGSALLQNKKVCVCVCVCVYVSVRSHVMYVTLYQLTKATLVTILYLTDLNGMVYPPYYNIIFVSSL